MWWLLSGADFEIIKNEYEDMDHGGKKDTKFEEKSYH